MRNPFTSGKKTSKSNDALPMTNTADLNHLEYARPIPNSTSYDSSLDAASHLASPDSKNMYAVSGHQAHLEPPVSQLPSRRVSRETHVRLQDVVNDEPDALGPDESNLDEKPEETNLFKMMIADFWALLRVFKTMSWKEFFRTMTKRYLWSKSVSFREIGGRPLILRTAMCRMVCPSCCRRGCDGIAVFESRHYRRVHATRGTQDQKLARRLGAYFYRGR